MEVDHPGSQQCVEMGWGNVALPIAKFGQNKYYINARKRIDIEKLIHFERDSLTGIVLVRVPLSSRTFAYLKLRVTGGCPGHLRIRRLPPHPFFPFRGCVPFPAPISRYGVSIPAVAELTGCNRSVGCVAFPLIEMMTRFTEWCAPPPIDLTKSQRILAHRLSPPSSYQEARQNLYSSST